MPDVVKLMEEAKADKAKEAASKSLVEIITEKAQTSPNAIVDAVPPYGPETPIPGFEKLTIGRAHLYEITWGMIRLLSEVASKYFMPHIISTSVGPMIVRGLTRLEWSELQNRILRETQERIQGHISQNSDVKAAELDVEMRNEEMLACAGTLYPEVNKATIRELPTGVVSQLAEAVLVASGHNANPLPPLKL